MHDFFDKLFNALSDIRGTTVISGFLGGVVYVFIAKNLTSSQMVSSVLVGLLTAYFVTPLFSEFALIYLDLKLSQDVTNGVAFLLGLFALFLIPAVIRKISKHK